MRSLSPGIQQESAVKCVPQVHSFRTGQIQANGPDFVNPVAVPRECMGNESFIFKR